MQPLHLLHEIGGLFQRIERRVAHCGRFRFFGISRQQCTAGFTHGFVIEGSRKAGAQAFLGFVEQQQPLLVALLHRLAGGFQQRHQGIEVVL